MSKLSSLSSLSSLSPLSPLPTHLPTPAFPSPGTSQWPRAGAPSALSPNYDAGLHGLVSVPSLLARASSTTQSHHHLNMDPSWGRNALSVCVRVASKHKSTGLKEGQG